MTDHIWPELPIALAGFVVYLVTVAVALRQTRARSPERIVVASALVVYALVVASATFSDRGANFWLVSIFFWFPALLFLMAFGALYKSISLRILADLLGQPAHTEPYSAVLTRYVETESFESRLNVMLENGFATLSPHGYALTERGRRLAHGVNVLQKLFAIERSG